MAFRFQAMVALLAVGMAVGVAPQGATVPRGQTIRVSIDSAGGQVSGSSFWPSMSADARFVAFNSNAPDLVEEDTNGLYDVFVHDRVTGRTDRVSESKSGQQTDRDSRNPAISADGRYVAFMSNATNLMDGRRLGGAVYVKDRATGEVVLVSETRDGKNAQGLYPAISGDGRHVAFVSGNWNITPDKPPNSGFDIYVRDLDTGMFTRIVCGDRFSTLTQDTRRPALSYDGRYVAYVCQTPDNLHVFVYDRVMGTTELASVSSDGVPGNDLSSSPAVSSDGRYVAFKSGSDNLVPYGGFPRAHVYIRDLWEGITTLVSRSSTGEPAAERVFLPGFVGCQVFLCLPPRPAISPNGRYIAFADSADNLVPEDTNNTDDVFLHDRMTGETRRVSVSTMGRQAEDYSAWPSVTNDGSVAYFSAANNLVRDDTNERLDVFVYLNRVPEPTCRDGGYEDGRVSREIHEGLEPEMNGAEPTMHTAGCAAASVGL